MVIAQDTPIVLLDEPTYLDINREVELMHLMRMNCYREKVIAVLHDLNQASRYCDHLVMLHNRGRVMAQGAP